MKTVIWVIILGAIVLATPFMFEYNQNIVSITSLSFTILQTIATVSMLIIAILLYDKFGLSSKLMDRQADEVLKLIDALRKINFWADAGKINYQIRVDRSHLKCLRDIKYYDNDSKKELVTVIDDYNNSLEEVSILMSNYWLPVEIKEKLKILNVIATSDIDNESSKEFVKLAPQSAHSHASNNWVIIFPVVTFKEFNDGLYNLVAEIDKWLKKNTNISINYFDEHNSPSKKNLDLLKLEIKKFKSLFSK